MKKVRAALSILAFPDIRTYARTASEQLFAEDEFLFPYSQLPTEFHNPNGKCITLIHSYSSHSPLSTLNSQLSTIN